ncbi:hypothetical protein [Sphingomonas sp. LT1P40]|uniref:hypothetical protein n=1 Tax=Alteristakelama amylovorans TaxID=3096166 RepID=UPI002FC5BD2D
MIRMLLLTALLATPAMAQEAASGEPPQRVRSVVLFGEDKCPKAESADEVVICSRPGDSPFRIPKALRKTEPGPGGTSWVRRAELVDEVNRAVLPGSCNPIGSFGQSGCTMQMLRQWKAEQREKKAAEAEIPGGED